jgi:hypothetical protein
VDIFKYILRIQNTFPNVSNDPLIRVLQCLMFSSPTFIELFFHEDTELLSFILQFFFNRIHDETTFSILLNPIIIFLEKSAQNSKIRRILQTWLIDKTKEFQIPEEYFKNVENERMERNKRIDLAKEKRRLENEEEEEEEEEEEGDYENQDQIFDPTGKEKTPLSVLIAHMTHTNYQFKTSVCNFLFTLCDQDVEFYIKLCGVGPAAGFLAEKGLLSSLMGGSSTGGFG